MTVDGKQFAYRIEETSGSDVIETLDRTCLAISEHHVVGIVGPEYSSEAKTISRFANRPGRTFRWSDPAGYCRKDAEKSPYPQENTGNHWKWKQYSGRKFFGFFPVDFSKLPVLSGRNRPEITGKNPKISDWNTASTKIIVITRKRPFPGRTVRPG